MNDVTAAWACPTCGKDALFDCDCPPNEKLREAAKLHGYAQGQGTYPKPRMPRQKRGRSKQDYGTPPEFLAAVKRSVCSGFAIDLAASPENAVCERYFTKADDSLAQDWVAAIGDYVGWLNPEFDKIAPWVEKANRTSHRACVLVLVPASVGSNWWRDHVHGEALVRFLNGRLTFVGCEDPYPKDLALLEYSPYTVPGYEVWNWRQQP